MNHINMILKKSFPFIKISISNTNGLDEWLFNNTLIFYKTYANSFILYKNWNIPSIIRSSSGFFTAANLIEDLYKIVYNNI